MTKPVYVVSTIADLGLTRRIKSDPSATKAGNG
jgi:hypothetical protein